MKNRILSLILAVLCIVAAIPATSLSVSASVEFSTRTLRPGIFGSFEHMSDHYSQGITIGKATFDNDESDDIPAVEVMAYEKTADKITYEHKDTGVLKTDYTMHLYSYNEEVDSDGQKVRLYDSQYVTVEYYYDTTGRDETDENGDDLTGKLMHMQTHSAYDNGEKINFSVFASSTTGIVANQWATAIIPFAAAANNDSLFSYENASRYQMGQWKIYPFGNTTGQQLYKGDKFYIKSITYSSFDISNPPDDPREVKVFLTYDDYYNSDDETAQINVIDYPGLKDLDFFTLPSVSDFNVDVMPEGKFSHWMRIDYGTEHAAGSRFQLGDLDNAYFCGVFITEKDIAFNYDGGTKSVGCYIDESITILDAEPSIDPAKKFIGWKENITGTIYQPGDTYTFTDSRAMFDAVYVDLASIVFTYGEEASIIKECFPTDSISMPTLPADAVVPEGKKFYGWVESTTGDIYTPGSEYYFAKDGVSFVATFVDLYEIEFVDSEGAFYEEWYLYDTVILPGEATAPEGKTFVGWREIASSVVYPANSEYKFVNADISFEAVFVSPLTVYYSADGVIDGIDNVYNTLASADAAISAAGGVGTIIVEGDLTLNNATHNFTAIDITIKGLNASQTATFNATTSVVLQSSVNTKITFDDITIVRADGTNDENFLNVVGATLVFGKNCTFKQGIRTTNNTKLNLYFGQSSSKNAGYTLEMNSPNIIIQQLAPHGGWSGGNFELNGDYKIIVNAGTVAGGFFVSRNGNGNGKPSTVNGNVTYEINGGTISNLFVGSHKNDKLNGTATLIINGGDISSLKYGNEGIYSDNTTGTYGNVAVIYNVKNILAGGYTVPTITKTGNQNDVKTSVLVVNNAELITSVPSLDVVDYNVQVRGGTAKPVFVGNNVSFEIISDNPEKPAPFANGKALVELSDNVYALEKGTTSIIFGPAGVTPRTVTYLDGDESIGSDVYFPGDKFLVSASSISKDGYVFEGFTYNGDIYNVGDEFTMPDEDVEFVVNWYNNSLNAYYVSIDGSDGNGGYKSAIPFKSVSKAYEVIGKNNGIIVIMGDYIAGGYIGNVDNSANFELGGNQHIIITGKDPYTGKVYDTKVKRPNNARPNIKAGHVEISYISEYHDGRNSQNTAYANNTPFVVKNSATFTLGTEYKFYYSPKTANNYDPSNYTMCGSQIETGSATSPTINVDGATQFVTVMDWGAAKITGDLTINIGPNATFSNYGVVLGGDHGSAQTMTVDGKTYVTVNGNKSGKPIALSGFKAVVSTVLNGLQVVLNETTMTVQEKPFASGGYTNNGPTYIVTTLVIPEGANVETAGFGKIKLTVPEGYSAVLAGATSGTYSEGEHTVSLSAGNTDINILKASGFVSVEIEGGETITGLIAGTAYTLPAGPEVSGKTFYGWNADGIFGFTGDAIGLPAEDGAVLRISPVYLDENSAIHFATTGNDAASGLSATEALSSLAEVEKRLAKFTGGKATMVIVDTLTAGTVTLPGYNGVLTVKGGIIDYTDGFTVNGDVVLEDITVKCNTTYKHIVANGHDITFGKGFKKAEGSQALTVHSGKQNSNMTGDQKITVLDGYIDTIQAGPYYISNSTTKEWTGNFEVVIDGGTVGTVTNGDGYTGNAGGFSLNGSEVITVKSGKLSTIQAGYLNIMTGDIAVFDYTNSIFTVKNHPSSEDDTRAPLPVYIFHMNDGVEAVSFVNKVLTVNKDAVLVSSSITSEVSTSFNVAETGEYSVEAVGAVLTSKGAQIRLTTPTALRFVAEVTNATIDEKESYGMLVYPTELLGDDELTHELVGEGLAVDVVAKKTFSHTDTSFTYTAAVTGIKNTKAGYLKKFTVVPYHVDDNGVYTYAEAMSYSLYDIAKAATGADASNEFILEIISTVEA